MPLDSHSNFRTLNNQKRILNASPNIGGFGRPVLCLFIILATTFGFSSASLAGSYVISHAPSGTVNQPVTYVEVTFSQEINAATFTTDDITLTAPGSTPVAVDPPVDGGNNVWRIDFAEQSTDGEYQLTIGSHIENMTGMELDEAYTGSFTIDTTPPPEITNLIVNTLGDGNSAVLDWSGYDEAGAGDVAYYRIYVETSDFSDIPETEFATVSAGQFTFAATGLIKGETYFFAVVAVDHAGNAVTDVTTSPASGIPTDIEPPEPVTNLQVDCTETALAFTWDHSSNSAGDLANYKAYFDGDPTGISVDSSLNSFTVTELDPATSYDFSVTSVDGDGNESGPVTINAITLLENPIDLSAVSRHGSVDLSWSDVASPEYIDHYNVYVSETNFTSVEGMTPRLTTTPTSVNINDLANDVTYYFAITTVNTTGGEHKSVNSVSAIPLGEGIDGYTVLMIHSDNEDGSVEFTDSSNSLHSITPNGNAHNDSGQVRFGQSSMYFDGSGDYLEIPDDLDWDFGTSPFTMEAWIWLPAGETWSHNGIVGQNINDNTVCNIIELYSSPNGSVRWLIRADGSGVVDIVSNAISTETWHHVAGIRDEDTFRLLIDGVLAGSATYSGSVDVPDAMRVGLRDYGTAEYFKGYIDEVRISKGLARWTEDFTPPTSPYEQQARYITGSIDHTKIDEDLTDLPVLLHLSDSSGVGSFDATDLFNELFSYEDRKKIAIRTSDGKQCYTEIESWDAENKEAWLWVKVPEISSTHDTKLRIYYDENMPEQNLRLISAANDAFEGIGGVSPDPNKWVIISGSPIVNDNKLHLERTSASDTLKSTYKISGDFDIQIDFDLESWPSESSWGLYFKVLIDNDNWLSATRLGSSIRQSYVQDCRIDGVQPTIEYNDTGDTSGSFKITRTGNSFRAYYSSDGINFTPMQDALTIGNSDDEVYIRLSASSWSNYPSFAGNFDNFAINSANNITGFVGDTASAPAHNVWDGNFVGVWHMSQDPSGGSKAILDSTNNSNDGTSKGSMTSSDKIDGLIGNGIDFDGDNDGIVVAHSPPINLDAYNDSYTIELLLKAPSQSGYRAIEKGYGTPYPFSYQSNWNLYDGTNVPGVSHSSFDNDWHFDALVVDHDTDEFRSYVDGGFADSSPNTITSSTINTVDLILFNNLPGTRGLEGQLDETRISKISRSPAWIKATYHSSFDDLIAYSSPLDLTPPAGVDTLIVDSNGDGTTVALNWTGYDEAAAGDVAYYKIYVDTSEITDVSGLTEVATVGSGQFNYTVQNLAEGATYYFAVLAVDFAGNANSTITTDPVSGSPVDVVPPEDVTNFIVSERFSDHLVLNWDHSANSAGDLAGYKIYYSNMPEGITLDWTLDTYDITGLNTGVVYEFTITAYDNDGNESTGVIVTGITLIENPGDIIGETGLINSINDNEQTILLSLNYQNPVILAQPPSYNGGDTAIVRITDVQSDRFTIKIMEAPDRDGPHTYESVSYIVLEAGNWQMPDGSLLKVGTVETAVTVGTRIGHSFLTYEFPLPFFNTSPVVFSQVQTNNDPHWVKTRMTGISATNFNIALEEDENQTSQHGAVETIGWIALEPSNGVWSTFSYSTNKTSGSVNHDWYTISFSGFSFIPNFLGSLMTSNGGDNAALRYQNLTTSSVQVKVEEDTTYDNDGGHNPEVIGYLLVQGSGPLNAQPYADITSPDLVSTDPIDGAELQEVNQVIITLFDQTGVDDNSVINSFALVDSNYQTITGSVTAVDDEFIFTPSVSLVDDIYTASFAASDAYSNSQTFSFSFTVDTVSPLKPAITGGVVYSGVLQPQPTANMSRTGSIILTGTREDNTRVWLDGVEKVALGSGDWSVNVTLSEGTNTLEVLLKDRAGNLSEFEYIDILADTVAPAITSVTPANNSILNTVPSNFTANFVEATSGLNMTNTVRIIRNSNYQDVTGSWETVGDSQLVFTPDSPFADSMYTINIQLEDNLANQGPAVEYRFTLDTVAPAAPVVNPVSTPTHNPTQTITGTKAADAAILLNGQEIIANTPATTWTHTVNLSGGSNIYALVERDMAGNLSPAADVEIVFDDVPPPAVTALSVDGQGDGTVVALDWTGYDESAHGDVDFYQVFAESASFSDVSGLTDRGTVDAGIFTYTVENLLKTNTYYFAVVAVDLAGNLMASVSPIIGVPSDIVPPEDVANLDVERTNTSLAFSWGPSADSYGDLAGYRVYFDGDPTGVPLDSSQILHEETDLTPATSYPFKVTAYDTDGNESQGSTITGITLIENPGGGIGERGVIADLNHNEQTVYLTIAYQNPVVFAKPVSYNGSEQAVVRIMDVQSDRFTFKIHEVPGTPDGGTHADETVSYFVFEAGDWQLPDGSLLKVGTLNTATTVGAMLSSDFDAVDLTAPYFSNAPVVISQVQTNNDPHWVKTRMKDISQTGFSIALEEEEDKTTPHGATETIGWLAIEPGGGNLSGLAYKAALTSAEVDENWHEITFSGYATVPGFLAAIETYNGTDNAGLRYRNLTNFVVEVMVEEDTTYDTETSHSEEVVGYFLVEGGGLLELAAFDDTEPPELVGTEPVDNTFVSEADQIVITLFDRHGSVDDAAVTSSIEVLDGDSQPVSGNVTDADDQFIFTPDSIPMPDGVYTVSFTGADMAGNSRGYSFSFVLDNQNPAKPNITGDAVTSGIIQVRPFANDSDSDTIALNGTRENDTSVWINDVEKVAIGSGDWSVDLTLNQGDNALDIYAMDAAGNGSPSEFVDIFVDSVAPTITSITPANDSFLAAPPAEVLIGFTETASGLDFDNTARSIKNSVDVEINGTWTLEGNSQIRFVPAAGIDDSVYTVSIQLTDNIGNQGPAAIYHFTVDSQASAKPSITGGTVTSGVIQIAPVVNESTTTSVTLTGTRENNTSVWINGSRQLAAGTGDWSKDVTLNQGDNTLTITLKDQAGNESDPVTVLILVDSVAPTVTGVTPADNSILNSKPSSVIIGFTETTTSLDLIGSTHLVRDNSFALVPGNWTISGSDQLVFTPQSQFAESIYTITVQLRDILGNQGSLHQYQFTIDTIVPAAPVVNPRVSPTVNPIQVITGTREAYAAILMNGQLIKGNEAGTSWTRMVTLSGGSNLFTFAARDRAGNLSEDVTVEIVYDDVAPLPVTALTVDGQGDGTRVTLNWTGYNEAEHGDIASYTIYRKDTAFTDVTELGVAVIGSVSAGTLTFQIDGLSAGTTYYFAVVAVDQTGNFRTDVTAVPGSPVDSAPPENVSNLSVQPFADRLVFTWNASPSGDLARYRICFAAEDCILLEGPNPGTSYEKTGLSPSWAYPLQVFAQDGQGNESSGVSITGYTLLDNPTGLSSIPHSGKVDLSWNQSTPAEYVKHYAVYVSQNNFTTVEGHIASLTTAGTSAQVAGLTNNTDYYFAVTAVNKSDGESKTVTTVAARPVPDSEGPQITNVKIGNDTLTQGHLVENSTTVSLTAADSAGVSRVEFSVDGSLTFTDYSGPTYSCYINVTDLADGSHTMTIAAFDTLGNITLEEYSFNVTMALPDPPVILQPANGATFNQIKITVSGNAQKYTEITLYNNDAVVAVPLAVDPHGNFATTLTLGEGQNKLEAEAANRAGTGPKSAEVYVTLNTAIPPAPTGLSAETRSGGKIRLTWQAPANTEVGGYNLYRSDQSFNTIAAAARVNSSLITGLAYDNLPSSDGIWYYRVTAVSEAGNESELSDEVAAESDSIGPRAVSIRYTPQGNVDPASGAMAPGRLDILLIVSESLQSDPFFTITPEGGVPISVDLTKSTDIAYTGFITITEDTPTARAWAVFSARDVAGNRGTTIDEGQSILVDTDGPAVSRLVVLPLSPIQNDQQDPVTLQVTAGLNEKSKTGSVIALGYLLPSHGTVAISINTISRIETQSGDAETWQGSFTLPADAGLSGVETLVFTYTGDDDLGNVSHEILSDNQFQVYQGELPPLAVPTGLTGAALPGGRIRLAWNAVDDAVAYQLYRKNQDETDLTAYARINSGLEYTDAPDEDGVYTYAIASIRSENSEESVSGMSSPVTVGSDFEAPPAPTNLVMDLISQGIRANWTGSATAEDVTYAFYRAATDTTPVADAILVKDGFSQTSWIDFNPSGLQHYYLVTAIDEVGNESAPCTPVYLDFALLPVSGITVVQQDYSLPVITWTHPEAVSVDGYDLYLGAVEDGVKLNSGLLTARTFTDVGYAGDARTYTLVAVSDNNDSLPRSLTLPQLSASLDESVRLKRGLMNRLDFMVANISAVAVGNIALKLAVDGRNHTSESFSLQVGESAVIPVIVGGYDDLPDVADMTATLEIKPNSGETVKIIRTSFIEAEDGMLVLRIFNEEFTRGATGKVGFTLENTGEEEIEILTARNTNKSASNQITFYLKDEDGNTLATAGFKQTIGDYITGLANGNTVARIPAGETFTSDLITMNVPINAPDAVYIRLSISKIYHHQGQTDQVSMNGLSTTYDIYLIDTSYYGQVDDITPQVSTGGEDIIISGRAVERSTGDPLPGVPLNLVVTVSGFERTYEVYTDDAGLFTHAFKPLKNEAGKYTVRAVHPDLRNRPVHGSFIISRVSVSPATVNLNISRNYRKSVNVKVATSKGTSLTDVRLVYKAADQPGGEFPRGVTLTVGGPKNIGSGGYVNLPFTIWADNTAAAANTLYLKVVSGAAGETGHGTVRINAGFYDAKPVLNFTPTSVVTGLAWNDTVVETLTLKNSGLGDLTDVTLSLHNTDGSSAPAWIYLNSAADQDTIATGASRKIDIAFSPTQAQVAEGNYTYYLKVASANYAVRNIYLSVAVTQSGQGDALFKISDIYTGTLDHNNQPVQGLKGAKIKVQNEEVTTETAVKTTDSLGEAVFSDLPAGRYKYRITAADHIEQIGRLWVKPGVTVNEEVFLDYNLVSVEWEVTETTIEDTYEITLNTTFETDVPVAVVVVSPASVTLPKMQAGDVFNGEFTLTNHGLIRADDIVVRMPPSDSHFKYEILGGVPTSLQAKERITIPYRITCLAALEPEEEGTGGGCRSYQTCITISYGCTCVNGQYVQNLGRTCFTRVYDCTSGGSVPVIIGGGGTVSVGGGGSGGGSTSKPAPKPKTISGVKCFPEPVRKERFCLKCWVKDTVANILQPVGSYVNTVMRDYHREDVDLSVKVPGGTVEINRWFYSNQWFWEHERNRLSFKQDSLGTGIESIDKGGVIYNASSGDGNVFIHDVFRIIKQDDTYRWEDTHGGWKAYNEFGRVTSYGTRTDVVARLLYESGENGKLIGVADRNDTQVLWYEYNTDELISAVYDGDNRRVEYTYTGGRLSGVKDVLNNNAAFEYDAKGRLNKTIDARGHYKTITYDGYGHVASVVDSQGEGSFFEYDYDEARKETFVRITSSAGKIKEIWYDRDGETKRVDINGRTVQKIAKDGRDLLITDEQGNVTRKEYDEWDNLTKVINPDGTFVATQYEHKFNKRTKQTDENGIVTEYEYDDAGNLDRKVEAAGTEYERVTEYTYDEDSNLLTTRRLANANTAEALTVMIYDTAGNLTSITDPEGGVTGFTSHDVMGNVLTKIDARGKQWTYEYDAAGRLTAITDPIVNDTEPLRNVTRLYYDAVGNKIRQVDPQGKETLYDYDENSNLKQVTDSQGNVTRFEYNTDNKLVRQIDAEGKQIRYEYDLDGRLLKTIDGNNNEIAMEYTDGTGSGCSSCAGAGGAANQPSRITYPTFAKEFGYDTRGRKTIEKNVLSGTETYSTNFGYDPAGNLITRTDKEDRNSGYDYDALNRLKTVTDSLHQVTEYFYDNRDNLTALTDAAGNTTWFEYDGNNRLVKETRPENQETTYQYDEAGNLIGKIDAKNQKTGYDYDDAGRLVEIHYFEAADHVNPVKTVTFSYDSAGNLTGYNDGITSAIYTYDNLYRKLSEKVNYGPFEQTNSYSYFKNGLKKTSTGPDSVTYAYTYDNNNQLTGVNIPGAGYITYNSYTWNRPNEVVLPGGSRREYVYDPLMRLKSIAAKDPGQNILLNYQYNYDKMDNITAKVTEHGEYDYGYDDLYRLTGADNPIQADEGFTYDAVGNRLTATGVADNWSYNDNNELQSFDNVAFEYDDNGNMTKKTDAGQVTNYIYNVEDRLTRVEDGTGSLISTYYYDPFGRRLWKEVNGVRTYFVYADEGLIAEVDATGSVIKSYGYKPGSTWSTDPLFMKVGTSYYFYQNDHLGTPQKLTAVSGAVVWGAKYSSFGDAEVNPSSTITNNLRFPGQYFDQETGLHYNYFRFYSPALGRYLKVDPIGFVGGNNLFLYVKNSPIKVIDPLGLICSYEWGEERLGEQISDPWWESQRIGYWSALAKKIGSYFIPSTIGKGKNKLPLPTVIPNSIFKYRIRSIKYVLYQVIKDKYWVCYDDCTEEQTKKDYYATIETDETMKSAIEAYEVDRYIGSPWATNHRDVDPLTIDDYNE